MADEIEEFLRRAAARRKQALEQARAPAPAAARRTRPEYSERSHEREVVEVDEFEGDDDVVVEARLIEPHRAEPEQSSAQRQADRSWQRVSPEHAPTSMPRLIEMLTHPEGLAQAFLLREILDRPQHRW